VKGHPYEAGFDPRQVPEKLLDPLRWASPKRVFVNSMSDLFQDAVPEEYIASVGEIMKCTPWHTYQVLTKRASRMAELLSSSLLACAKLPNVWWGVSVEDRQYGLPRIDRLREVPAATRFLSVEPLLEDLGEINLDGIHWVIVGGESGHGARRMEKAWVESVRMQCADAGVPFFFKQWGGVQKIRTGRMLNGQTYDELPRTTPPRTGPSLMERRALLQEQENRMKGNRGRYLNLLIAG
jgi:protein gp37